MALRSPTLFSGAFLLLAIAYTAYFDIKVRTDPDAAEDRFDALAAAGAPRRAAPFGERAITLHIENGATAEEVAPLKARVAEAEVARARYQRGADLLREALSSGWVNEINDIDRVGYENRLGRAYILAGKIEEAVSIFASFLELAGDAAADPALAEDDELSLYYADRVIDAASVFAGAINHTDPYKISSGSIEQMLATTNHMATLGGFYSMRKGNEYAAAGLLSSAYETRKRVLGAEHQNTVQLTLILGPLYAKMGRLEDAEKIYLDAFHAQERVKGPNSPDLSLYLKLLAGIYEQQNRFTEAQALYEHIRGLFQDAFGAQRYAINRELDRRSHINRPVSQFFPLEPDYAPSDLVSAAEFSIPTSKAPTIDEMKIRLAADQDADPREANLPVRLAQLISLCRSESGERIALRSGYRSYRTQRVLHELNEDRGTVTPAGVSEHQTGLATDINVNDRFMRQTDRAFQCFEENAFRYGFILSYPPGNDYLPGKDTYEPWHWRYVGIQTAQLYREAGPHNQPQEFLAALPCYQERAANGLFPNAGETDICQADVRLADGAEEEDAAEETPIVAAFPPPDPAKAARILNEDAKPVRGRH